MGRLPLAFAGKTITYRIPYNVAAEIDVPPDRNGIVFPESSFLHNVDKPFEIHRVIVRLTARGTPEGFTSPQIFDPQPTTLEERIRLRFLDFSKNENLTKSSTLVSLLLSRISGAFDLEEPYTIVRSEGFQVQIDSQAFPNGIILNSDVIPESVPTDFVRVEINFQGYLIIIGPPSEVR